MRSDFINKRDLQRRRNLTSSQNYVDGEVIVIPEFDTMFLHEYAGAATATEARWQGLEIPSELRLTAANPDFKTLPQMAIGLLNPWDDGHDRPDNAGPLAAQTRPRTPTRIAMAFNLASLPTNAQIIDAKLNLTVTANKRNWD